MRCGIKTFLFTQGEQFAEHALHGPGGSLTSAAAPNFTVELHSLFAA